MISDRRVSVVLPAYNAERTLRQTVADIPHEVVDDIILTDDASLDNTVAVRVGQLIARVVRAAGAPVGPDLLL